MNKPKIITTGPHNSRRRGSDNSEPFTAHLDDTNFTFTGVSVEAAKNALISYAGGLGWPSVEDDYQVVEHTPHHTYPHNGDQPS